MTISAGSSTLEAVRTIAPIIETHVDTIEQERLLPKAVSRALIEAGAFRMLVPRSLGGEELDPMAICEVVDELSIQDGAVGWCSMIGACNGLFGGLLPRAGASEIVCCSTGGTWRALPSAVDRKNRNRVSASQVGIPTGPLGVHAPR